MNRFRKSLHTFFKYKHFIVACAITTYGITNFASLEEIKKWPTADAIVLTSSYTPSQTDSVKATLDFSYRYNFQNKSYVGSKSMVLPSEKMLTI